MTTPRHLLILSATLLLGLAARAEQLPVIEDSPTWTVSGTTIAVQAPSGRMAERGLLRVVGPRGYRAVKRFTGGTVALDLLVDGRFEKADRGHAESGAPSAPEVTNPTTPTDRPALARLPDGAYRFEVVLGGGPGGTSRFHYRARSRAGSLVSGGQISGP